MIAPFLWRDFIQYFESKAFVAELIPLGLKSRVGVIPHPQLKFMPIENAGEIERGPDQHSVIDDAAYLVDTHRAMIQLILSFQFSLFCAHFYTEVAMEIVEERAEYGIPVIDINPLIGGTEGRHAVASEIGQACRECGFFYITGHGVEEGLQRRLEYLIDTTAVDDRDERWDRASVHEFRGTYGDYLLDKVSKVFPQLRCKVL